MQVSRGSTRFFTLSPRCPMIGGAHEAHDQLLTTTVATAMCTAKSQHPPSAASVHALTKMRLTYFRSSRSLPTSQLTLDATVHIDWSCLESALHLIETRMDFACRPAIYNIIGLGFRVFLRTPNETCIFLQKPIETWIFLRKPIETCIFLRKPIESCSFLREPIETCTFLREPIQTCIFLRGPIETWV